MKRKKMETINEFITPKYPGNFNSEYKERFNETIMEKGRTIHKVGYKTINPADRFSGYRASDFDLQTLISVGALNDKGECFLNSTSPLVDADMIEKSIDNNLNEGGNE